MKEVFKINNIGTTNVPTPENAAIHTKIFLGFINVEIHTTNTKDNIIVTNEKFNKCISVSPDVVFFILFLLVCLHKLRIL